MLDVWFAQEVKPRLQGRAFLIRYADDFIMGFACEQDARKVLEVLPKRFGKFGLTLHPEKTRLVPFRRPSTQPPLRNGPTEPPPGVFDLLGFRHYWARSRRGNWVVKRKTAPSRFRRALTMIAQWCRFHRHEPIAVPHYTLGQQLHGHYAYYGLTGNAPALKEFWHAVQRLWRHWLSRRNTRGPMPWPIFQALLQRYPLPPPVVVHSVYRPVAHPR